MAAWAATEPPSAQRKVTSGVVLPHAAAPWLLSNSSPSWRDSLRRCSSLRAWALRRRRARESGAPVAAMLCHCVRLLPYGQCRLVRAVRGAEAAQTSLTVHGKFGAWKPSRRSTHRDDAVPSYQYLWEVPEAATPPPSTSVHGHAQRSRQGIGSVATSTAGHAHLCCVAGAVDDAAGAYCRLTNQPTNHMQQRALRTKCQPTTCNRGPSS